MRAVATNLSWKNAGAALSLAMAAAGAGAATAERLVRNPLPQVSGTLHAEGLHAAVSIDRDAWGIPHIAASFVDDLFFGNGYVHAQDRLWQIELVRRIGCGRLSELLGESTVEADRLLRHIGLRRVAEEEARLMPQDDRMVLDAYCRGINHYLEARPRHLPLEFNLIRLLPPPLLRWRPEPFTVADVLTMAKLLAFGLSVNWIGELVRSALVSRIGAERAAVLEPLYAAGFPSVTPSLDAVPTSLAARLAAAYQELQPFLSFTGAGAFSNNWVVDGTKTASGKPLLANDPHLQLQMPSIWYEIELNGPGYAVVGASFPGAPGVVIGHNRHIAWGVTNALCDVQDLVIEHVDPATPRRYRFQDAWREGHLVREQIQVRGRSEPIVDEVLITHHGPIIGPAIENEDRALALRWTGLEPGTLTSAVLGINRATDWQSFCTALRAWDCPPQNFVYADVDGNIGYYTPGNIPIRTRGLGALPVPGWTGDYEWRGYVPFEELPHLFNPPAHQIVTANNKLVGDNYPHFLGADWLPGYRAQRITALLDATAKLTVDDFKRMQRDVYSLPGLAAQQALSAVHGDSDTDLAALHEAAAWDGRLTADTVGGCVCMVFQHCLLRATFGPILGDLTEAYLGSGSSPLMATTPLYGRAVPLLYELHQRRDDGWFERMGVPDRTWTIVEQDAWKQTVALLQERLGPAVSAWRWGRLNAVRFTHPLAGRTPLKRLFERGPLEMGGDDNTVAAAAVPIHNPHHSGGWASSYRQIIDLGSLGNSRSMHTTGQSGHLQSEHYDDMIAAWQAFRYHPMSLPIGDARRELGGHLVLEPMPAGAEPKGGRRGRA